MTRALPALLAFAIVVASLSANAQTPPAQPSAAPGTVEQQAEAAINRGVALRRSGDDEHALDEFRRAYELSHGARARAQVALAEQAMGRWMEADADLSGALADTSDPWVNHNRAVLEGALTTIRTNLGMLSVSTNQPNAELWVNGTRVTTLPMSAPVRVPTGAVAIEVRRSGFTTALRTAQIAAGELHREWMPIVPLSDSTAGTNGVTTTTAHGNPTTGSTTTSQSTRTSPAQSSHIEGPHDEGANTHRPVAFALMGVGAAFLLGGVGMQIYWQNRVHLYNDDSQCNYGFLTRSERCGAILTDANVGEGVMIASYAVGGVLAAAGIVVALLPGRRSGDHARIGCSQGPGALGVSCGGTF